MIASIDNGDNADHNDNDNGHGNDGNNDSNSDTDSDIDSDNESGSDTVCENGILWGYQTCSGVRTSVSLADRKTPQCNRNCCCLFESFIHV